ncbi:reverse transcriptase domain-containing protein [Tanacetum coccineum]
MKNQGTSEVKGKNWNKMMEIELGEGYSFIKKKCFVCGSLSHLIKDCDYYEKKMAREAEFKKQRVFNTGNRVAKQVWTNSNRVNHANQFIPRSVQLNAARPNINSVRPNINTGRTNVNSVRLNINTGRTNVNSVRPYINSVRQNVNSVKTNINIVRSKQPVPTNNINSFSPGTAVKTSAGYNWRRPRPNSNYNSRSNLVRTMNAKGPQGRPKPEKAWQGMTETRAPVDLKAETDIWKLYTDGASNEHGSGAGLRIATTMKVKKMLAFMDSKLVANQVEGSYEANGEKTKKYTEKTLEMIRSFSNFQISYIPREENRKVDALSNLAAVQCEGLTKGVLIEELNERSVDTIEINAIIEESTRTWMTPIQEYIEKGILLEDATKARTI